MILSKALGFIFFMGSLIWAQEGELKSYIYVDGLKSKDLTWVKKEGSSYLLEWSVLAPLLKERVIDEAYQRLNSYVDQGWISFSKIKKENIKVHLDEESLDVFVTLFENTLKKQTLSLYNSKDPYQNKERIGPAAVSSYLNLNGNKNFHVEGGAGTNLPEDKFLRGSLDYVLNVKGLVFENNWLYDESSKSDKFYRNFSRVVYNNESKLMRFSLGDFLHPVSYRQSVFSGAGISISKAFDINPLFFRRSLRRSQVFLEQPSMVEVYVNGKLTERKRYNRGQLDVTDYPFYHGENEVKIRVIDDYGRAEEQSFLSLYNISLLDVGVSDYSFNFGYFRDHAQTDEYDFNKWSTTNFYKRGVAENLVLGGQVQALYNEDQLYGLELTYGSRLGISSFDSLYFTNKTQNGWGFKFEHQSHVLSKGALNNVRSYLSAEYSDPLFRSPQEQTTVLSQPLKWNASFSLGQNFMRSLRGSFGYNYQQFHSGVDKNFITNNVGWSPSRNWNLNVSLKVNVDDPADSTVFLTANWFSAVKRQQMISTYRAIDQSFSTDYSFSPIQSSQNLRLSAGVQKENNLEAYRGFAKYQNQRLELQLDHLGSRPEGLSQSRSAVRFGTGLAFAGGVIAITRPVQNSFALVKVKGRPQGQAIPLSRYHNHQRGEANVFGPAAVANVTPYFKDHLFLNANSLPAGYSLSQESFYFKPRYKSGVVLRAELLTHTSVSGKLKTLKGDVIRHEVGQIWKNDLAMKDFFTNHEGEFFVEDLKPGTYKITIEGYNEKGLWFEVKPGQAGIIKLGDLTYATNGGLR